MIRVKTFTSQLKIFHTRNELRELDQAVNDFVGAQGIRKVISVSAAVTTGVKGEAIGIIRVITYEEPGEGAREKVLGKMEEKLKVWGDEIENLQGKDEEQGGVAHFLSPPTITGNGKKKISSKEISENCRDEELGGWEE